MYGTATGQPASRGGATSLPQRLYTDDGVYQHDVGWLRQHLWFLVGHASEVPKAGDYFLYEFDRDSVIVIRDQAGQIRAHHNVCRHRGSRLCVTSTGTVRGLTCPYHAWAYGLDGQLRGAPYTPADFDKGAYALLSCHVRVHCGLIFLSFADAPPDFDAYIGFLTRELELQDLQRAKVAKRTLVTAHANWKLVVENNLECYHCGPAHRTYCAAHAGMPLGKPQEYVPEVRYERVRRMLEGSPGEAARQFQPMYANHASGHFRYLNRQLIGKDVMTESMGGKPVAPLMGQNTYNGVQTTAEPSPLTTVILNPDHAVFYTFTPRAVRRTDMAVMWLVNEAAREGVDFDADTLVTVWETTLKEDKVLTEHTQLGVDSSAYRPGPYIQSEMIVAEFDRWYLERVAGEQPRD